MCASADTDKCYFTGIELLQLYAVPDGNQPVFCTVKYIRVAGYMLNPFVGSQLVAQNIPYRKKRKKPGHHFPEIIIGRVEDKVTGTIIRSYLRSKPTANASAVHDDMVFGAMVCQRFVNELHVIQHFFFASFACTLAESAIVDQHHIVVVTVEIPGVFCPALDASRISMKIKNQSGGVRPVKMQPIDPYPRLYIKK